jgi:hypothetical protein
MRPHPSPQHIQFLLCSIITLAVSFTSDLQTTFAQTHFILTLTTPLIRKPPYSHNLHILTTSIFSRTDHHDAVNPV